MNTNGELVRWEKIGLQHFFQEVINIESIMTFTLNNKDPTSIE